MTQVLVRTDNGFKVAVIKDGMIVGYSTRETEKKMLREYARRNAGVRS
jgi:hypothetical protein